MGRFSICPSVHSSVHSFVHPPLEGSRAGLRPRQAGFRASQAGLKASQAGLRASQPLLIASQPGLRGSEACLAGWLLGPRGGEWTNDRTVGRMDKWMDGQMDGKSPYSTGLRPLSGLLPCYSPITTQKLYKAGQGNHWIYDASWQLVGSKKGPFDYKNIVQSS